MLQHDPRQHFIIAPCVPDAQAMWPVFRHCKQIIERDLWQACGQAAPHDGYRHLFSLMRHEAHNGRCHPRQALLEIGGEDVDLINPWVRHAPSVTAQTRHGQAPRDLRAANFLKQNVHIFRISFRCNAMAEVENMRPVFQCVHNAPRLLAQGITACDHQLGVKIALHAAIFL